MSTDLSCTPPEIRNEARHAMEDLLPEISKERYMMAYKNFIDWRNTKRTESLSESVFMAYFKELSLKYKPSSLWTTYSMLKATIRTNNGVDLKGYYNLTAYLKRQSDGFRPKKSKVLESEHIEKLIKEAPDSIYLATKVALIFGITGACRRQELTNITVKDIERHNQMLLVKIPNTKTKVPRSFTINGAFYDIVMKYDSLPTTKAKNDRFFQNYQNGKCTCQPIGVHKFGSMPKEIAKFLDLPEPESYTGHSFRRSSATLLANSGADILTLKRHGGWRSSHVAESYVEDSIQNKNVICDKITKSIRLECKAGPSTEAPSTLDDWVSPTYTVHEQIEQSQISIENECLSIENVSAIPPKAVN